MSVNKYTQHLVVLPEDNANRNLANGFTNHHSIQNFNQIQILLPAGGWLAALEKAEKAHFTEMKKLKYRHLLILIDFDNEPDRADRFRQTIPHELAGRVFVMGVLSEPEPLKADLGRSLEAIGADLCQQCADAPSPDAGSLWRHNLLKHNLPELARLRQIFAPILF
jgi:hypothetical protein